METYLNRFFRFQAQTSDSPMAIEVSHAKGVYVYDRIGKEYLDLISGISVSNLGHNVHQVNQAVKQQIDNYTYMMVYGEYVQSPQVKLAHLLVESLNSDKLNKVYFVNSGSEANEGAIKLARKYTGRKEIISMKKAYHGSTMGCLSIIGESLYKAPFEPLIPCCKQIRYNNFEDLECITISTAAVFVEPVMGEAGVILPKKGYLQKLRDKCNKTGALLVFDEIQTGFGRTGSLFAFKKYKVDPDIITIAKAMGAGYPIGAFIANSLIMDSFSKDPPLSHITTFGGHAVSAIASYTGLKILVKHPEIIESVEEKGIFFISNINARCVRSIRQVGLLIALELESFELVQKVVQKCKEKGILTDWFLFNKNSLRVAPPLIISEEELVKASQKVNKILESI